jgi:hypothetical protein
MAGVIGSEGLIEATSNDGVCANADPTANPMNHNKRFDTALYLACKKYCPISESTIAIERQRAEGAYAASWGIPPNTNAAFRAKRCITPHSPSCKSLQLYTLRDGPHRALLFSDATV